MWWMCYSWRAGYMSMSSIDSHRSSRYGGNYYCYMNGKHKSYCGVYSWFMSRLRPRMYSIYQWR
jgi:hypothetical protein